MKDIIRFSISSIATLFIYLMGGWDIAIQTLLLFIVVDYISGLLKAAKLKELNSKIGWSGFLKKIGMLLLVVVSVGIDWLLGQTELVRNIVIYYLVANEGLSIIENLSILDIGIPNIVKEKLEQLKEGDSDE